MSNCSIDTLFNTIITNYRKEIFSNSLARKLPGATNILKQIISDIVTNNAIKVDLLSEQSKKDLLQQVFDTFPLIFNPQNMSEGIRNNILTAFLGKREGADSPEDAETSDRKLLSKKFQEEYEDDYFFDTAYKDSPRAKMYVEKEARKNMVLSFLYYTDVNGHKHLITNLEELQEAINRKLQELLQVIVDYLKDTIGNDLSSYVLEYNRGRKQKTKEDTILKHLLDPKIYQKGKRSDFHMLQLYFPSLFQTPMDLEDLLNNSLSLNPDLSKLKYFKAYNAMVQLKYFDNLVRLYFGKLITINLFAPRFSPERYLLSMLGSNVYTTWRTTDEIWLDKEVNTVVLLMIQSTLKYLQGNEHPEDGMYLEFNDFTHVIGKLKINMNKPLNLEYIKNSYESWKNNNKETYDKLSLQTKDLLETHNGLLPMLWASRLNPLKYWKAIMEIVATISYKDLNTLVGATTDKFTKEDSNIFYSLYKELIGGENSLGNSMTSEDFFTQYNYLGFLTQVIDSTFNTRYIQYFVDDNGEIQIRPLRDLTLAGFLFGRERKINSNLSKVNYIDFKQQYNIEVVNTKNVFGKEIRLVKFVLNNKKVTVSLTSGTISTRDLQLTPKIVKDILGIDVDSPGYLKAYNNANGTEYTNTTQLVNSVDFFKLLVIKAITRTAVNNELLRVDENNQPKINGKPYKNIDELKSAIKNIFGRDININEAIKGINITDSEDLPSIKLLGNAEAYLRGFATASQIKGADGNAVSGHALSRLVDTYMHQFSDFDLDTAAKDFLLLSNPAFLGVFQVKELKDDEVLPAEDMAESDYITGNFIHDFIGQIGRKEGDIIYIIPQVISDKKFIGKLGINLNAPITIPEYPSIKTWKDIYNSKDYSNIMELLIYKDFNKFFNKVNNKIKKDFNTLFIKTGKLWEVAQILENELISTLSPEELEKFKERKIEAESLGLPVIDIFSDLRKFSQAVRTLSRRTYINSLSLLLKAELAKIIKDNGLNITISDLLFNPDYTSLIQPLLLPIYKELTAYDLISLLTLEYNNEHPLEPIEFIDLVHFVNSEGDILENPLLLDMLQRFSSPETVKDFFKERILSSASSMIDKGFSYKIKEVEIQDNSTITARIKANNVGWVNGNKIAIAKITFPIKLAKAEGKTEETFYITDKSDLRNILNFYHPNILFRNDFQIKYDVFKKYIPEQRVTEIEQEVKKQLSEEEQWKFYNLVSTKLEEEILNNAKNKMSEELKVAAIQEWRSKRADLALFTDDQVLSKIIRAPYYQEIDTETKQENDNKIKYSLFTLKELLANNPEIKYEINPNVGKYSYFDYLFSEEWIISTVGHHMAHPNKKFGTNTLLTRDFLMEDEAIRKEALNKRNVSETATMHEFLLGMLTGIPSYYNVAVIQDVKDTLYNISGNIFSKVKPYDGATFVNPFTVYLENNSLGGSRAGVVKKQFVHFYNKSTGTGGIIKTAGFGLTNMLMRDSKELQQMMKSMTDRVWRDLNGNLIESWDITAGNTIIYGDSDIPGQLGYFYFKNKGKYYARKIISVSSNNTIAYSTYEINEKGEPQGASVPGFAVINSNYKLWQFFGGKDSLEMNSNGLLVPSEKSIEYVVEAMNKNGIKLTDNSPTTLDDLYLFMKHSDIHYFATEGAVKQGAANINSNKAYSSGEPVNFMRIKMLQAGIQLDKEHSADGEDVSLMTQVISACVSRGFTFDKASELYTALASIAQIGLEDEWKGVTEFFEGNIDKVKELVIDSYIRSLAKDSNPNRLAVTIADELIKATNRGIIVKAKDKFGKLPLSDTGIYNLLVSKLSSALTKAAIKIEIDGVLSMLCPSYQMIKLYGNKMLHEYESDEELEEEQRLLDNQPIELFNIQCGRKYKVWTSPTEFLIVNVQTPLDYYDLKQFSPYKITEYILEGRDLAHYNCEFTCGNEHFNIYDLDSVNALFQAIKRKASKEELSRLHKVLQQDLLALELKKLVVINGEPKLVTKIDRIIPYEVILPKYFKTSFGLDLHDNLSEINEQYFFRKLLEKFSPQIPNEAYDVCLKRADGKHIYIKLKSKERLENMNDLPMRRSTRKNKVYRVNETSKEEIYELASKDDNLVSYEYNGNNYEIIETDNLDFYLETMEGVWDMYIANREYLLSLNTKEWKSDLVNDYLKSFRDFRKILKANKQLLSIIEYNEIMRDGTTVSSEYSSYLGPKLQALMDRASKMYASFLKALELVAARIPALSQQSFMGMKIVGFDNYGKNTAYVSTMQILLQGSDFDIDTATFTRYATGKDGMFVHWSPLALLTSYEGIKASDNLPFPTNKEVEDKEYSGDSLNVHLFDEDDRVILHSPEQIEEMSQIIRFVNKNGIRGLRQYNGDELTENLKKSIITLINKHNTSLYTRSRNKRLDATKNYLLTKMFDIIVSPANLIEAQVPIDEAKDIINAPLLNPDLKDAVIAREAIPGDPTVKATGIYKNQTGKKGVGICATALKGYFATFLLNESILFDKKSTKDQLKNLILGKKGIYIKGKRYYGIANAYCPEDSNGNPLPALSEEEVRNLINELQKEDNNVTPDQIRQIITYTVNDDLDAAVILSAMLSAATDNAKDGSLGKLNAGTKTLGMYMYGIILGMSFDDLSDIMMSPIARELSLLLDGNRFNGQPGLGRMNRALEYLSQGFSMKYRDNKKEGFVAQQIFNLLWPVKILSKSKVEELNKEKDDLTKKLNTLKSQSFKDKAQERINEITKILEENSKNELERTNQFRLIRLLSNNDLGKFLAIVLDLKSITKPEFKERTYPSETDLRRIDTIYSYASKMSTNSKLITQREVDTEEKEAWKAVSDFVYLRKITRLDSENYIALSTLAKGAEEFTTLGLLLKLNQGLPNANDDFLTFLDKIESILSKCKVEKKSENLDIISDFILQPEAYISKYEYNSVNILDVLHKAPHFWEYFKTSVTLNAELQVTSKFRITRYYGRLAAKALNITKQEDKVKMYGRLRRMTDDWVVNEWLILKDIRFTIPKGLLYYDVNGNLQVAKDQITMNLGSYHSRASFKLFMELTVIPNLKKGFNGRNTYPSLSNNAFIKDLSINSFDRTPNYVVSEGYTLPINMSPRTDSEQSIFNYYKSAFNSLCSSGFSNLHTYYYVGNTNMRLMDMFFLYNIVAYQNLAGESYLKSILQDVANRGYLKDFYTFESNYDESGTLPDIPKEYWMLWATPVGGIFNANTTQVFASDKNSFGRQLYKKQNDTEDDFQELPPEAGEGPKGKSNKYGKTYIKYSLPTFDANHIGFKSEFSDYIRDPETGNPLLYTTNKFKNKQIKCIFNHGKLVALEVLDYGTIYPRVPIEVKYDIISTIENGLPIVKKEINARDINIQIMNEIERC